MNSRVQKFKEELAPLMHKGQGLIVKNEEFYQAYTKKELVRFSYEIGEGMKMSLKKKDMIAKCVNLLLTKERLEERLLLLDDYCYEILKELVSSRTLKKKVSLFHFAKLDQWYYKRFLYISTDQYIVIPEQAADVMKDIFDDQEYQEKRKKCAYLGDLLEYCKSVYGIIDDTSVLTLYQYRFKEATKAQLRAVDLQLSAHSMAYEKQSFVALDLTDGEEEDIKKAEDTYPIALPSKEEIDDYICHGFPYENPIYGQLLHFLITQFSMDPFEAVERMRHYFYAISRDYTDQFFMDLGYTNDRILQCLFECMISECINTSRLFEWRGHIPHEDILSLLERGEDELANRYTGLFYDIEKYLEPLKEYGFKINEDHTISYHYTKGEYVDFYDDLW
jgi:hypothetical protein